MAIGETAELAVKISLNDQLSRGITGIQGKLSKLDAGLGRTGKGAGQMAAGFAKAGAIIATAGVGIVGAAAKAAIDFEDAFAGVVKTVDEAELKAAGSSFEELARQIRGMATEIPITAVELARLGEAAGALGVRAQDIDEFIETTAKLGVTTDLTADAAADALGRIGTILGFTGRDYQDFADVLVNLGNQGASTESEIAEITQRFAAEGKAAGLATIEIAGLASATASLGFEPERGGTALSRVFANLGTNISLANGKGKAFAKITGQGIKELQASIDRGDGLNIFLDVLEGIKGLSPTDANRALKALGVNNTSDRTIFRTMAENLPFVNEQLKIAADSTGALSEEAQKKFATVRSALVLLKNNVIEAALTFAGDPNDPRSLVGAIGASAKKLSEFLKQPGNAKELAEIGSEVGEAISGIDWGQVVGGAKSMVGVLRTAVDVAKILFDGFRALPDEIEAATVGFLALNKLSGGLIGAGAGNIVGGIVETGVRSAGSRIPGGIGKLFAQPVFVTNWPAGGIGGAATGGKGGGPLALIGGHPVITGLLLLQSLGLGIEPKADKTKLHGGTVPKDGAWTKADVSKVTTGFAEQRSSERDIKTGIATVTAATSRHGERVQSKLDEGLAAQRAGERTMAQGMAIQQAIERVSDAKRAVESFTALSAQLRTQGSVDRTRGAVDTSATRIVGALGMVAATIRANRPIISPTTVNNTTVVQNRYGRTSGSRHTGRTAQ